MQPQIASPLEDRLRRLQRDHDNERKKSDEGAAASDVDADNELWLNLGCAIADLARMISRSCRNSCCSSARPEVSALAARLSEAIDDQLDLSAWRIVDAAARLNAAR